MDKEIYHGLKKVFDQNLEAALITVTSVLGSAPRKPGSKMLVFGLLMALLLAPSAEDVVRLRPGGRPSML